MTDSASIRLQDLLGQLKTAQADAANAVEKATEVYDALLLESRCLDAGNFERIETADLEKLFRLYDELYFKGLCGAVARQDGNSLQFRLSPRMTSAAGKTTQRRKRGSKSTAAGYEIAISTTLLFQTFEDDWRPITVSGVACKDRLEALQRIFEHEILHLLEMLIWNDSSCAKMRFRNFAAGCFGHTQSTHQLITPREVAREVYGLRNGQRVQFVFEGVRMQGIVNRVTKRATVLVPDPHGQRYSDGQHYSKYYIPLHMLTPVR